MRGRGFARRSGKPCRDKQGNEKEQRKNEKHSSRVEYGWRKEGTAGRDYVQGVKLMSRKMYEVVRREKDRGREDVAREE